MGGGSSNSIDIYNSNWESINYNSTSLQIVEGINDENILYDENGQKKDKRLKVEKELLKTHPFRCIGLIKIFDQLGDASVGTAFLISRNVILTTAHSIYYKHPVKNDLRFAVNILFYPALRGSIDKS
jgi:V8-like Glu-specific endopeptidase